MKSLAAALALGFASIAAAQPASPPLLDAAAVLQGRWQVDLRAGPEEPPYFKDFVIDAVTAKRFAGSFYDTPIESAHLNTAWGAVRLAFVTSDGKGLYFHSAIVQGDRMEGMTLAQERGFLARWVAVKP